MTVFYSPVLLDNLRSQENQTLLLSKAAGQVWKRWCERNRDGELIGIQGQDKELDSLMQSLREEIVSTDIFYSGVHAGRKNA